jgi:hypothetical protein
MTRLLNEPVLLGSAVRAIVVAVLYFAHVSVEGSALVLVAVEATLALVTRANVRPTRGTTGAVSDSTRRGL